MVSDMVFSGQQFVVLDNVTASLCKWLRVMAYLIPRWPVPIVLLLPISLLLPRINALDSLTYLFNALESLCEPVEGIQAFDGAVGTGITEIETIV
jgi:hypothetical protein